MDGTSITTSSFTVTGPSGAAVGTVSYNSTTKVATFTPSTALAPTTTYTAKLATTIHDTSGMALANTYTWTFTTGT
jgi:hypothetical protein